MSTSRKNNTQYDGQYHALVAQRNGKYELKAFDDPVGLIREVQRSSSATSRSYSPLKVFEDVSWKALRDLETEVQRANDGFEVNFEGLFN